MRLLVVSGSPPESSRSRPSQRRIAAQPPGPGLPEQAPSVWTSTTTLSGSGEAIGRDPLDAAVETELAQVLARVLGLDQRALDLVQRVVEPRHQEAERRPPGEDRQGVHLRLRERQARPVALEQRLCLRD